MALGIVGAAIRCSDNKASGSVILRHMGDMGNCAQYPFCCAVILYRFGLPALGLKLKAASCLAGDDNQFGCLQYRTAPEFSQCQRPMEAGRVLGLSRSQTFFRVILPPLLQRIYPALVSQCIIVMLGFAVVSQVAFEELTFTANSNQSRTFLSFRSIW